MEEKITLAVSASTIDLISCGRRWQFSKLLNKTTFSKSEPMEKGDLLHKLLEYYYKNIKDGKKFDESVLDAINQGRDYAISLDLSVSECEIQVTNFQEYCQYYRNDDWFPLAVEEPFSKLVYEDDRYRVLFEGKEDLVILFKGKKYVVDHKGTSRHKDAEKLKNQFQMLAFVFDCDTVIRNEIGFQTSYKPKDRFHRQMIPYDADGLTDWAYWTVRLVIESYEKFEQEVYQPNFTACWSCNFKKVCETTPGNREWVLNTQFKNKSNFDLFLEK